MQTLGQQTNQTTPTERPQWTPIKRVITLKYEARCADCGTLLQPGTKARWYGRGRVYGFECHSRPLTQLTSTTSGETFRANQNPWRNAEAFEDHINDLEATEGFEVKPRKPIGTALNRFAEELRRGIV